VQIIPAPTRPCGRLRPQRLHTPPWRTRRGRLAKPLRRRVERVTSVSGKEFVPPIAMETARQHAGGPGMAVDPDTLLPDTLVTRSTAGANGLPICRVSSPGRDATVGSQSPHGAWGRNYLHNVALDPLDRYIEDVSVFTRLNSPRFIRMTSVSSWERVEDAALFVMCGRTRARTTPLDPLLTFDSKNLLCRETSDESRSHEHGPSSLEARVPLLESQTDRRIAFLHSYSREHEMKRSGD